MTQSTQSGSSASPRTGVSRRVTIEDVARDTGVSISAVSKVIRGASGVSPRMHEKVTEAVVRLGYRPNTGARAMRGRSYTIGVMISDMTATFQQQLVSGIGAAFVDGPYQEIVIPAGDVPVRQHRGIEALVDRQVDGLILIGPLVDHAYLEKIGSEIPLVVIARHGGGSHFDTVVDDDFEGARLVVDHLVSLGHERILHTSVSSGGLTHPHVPSHVARRDGYVTAMKSHGLAPDVIVTSFTEKGGHEAAIEALARRHPPTAVFAGADDAAFGVLRAAEESGLRVPDDLSIAGYDNIFATGVRRISLTTVDQSGFESGTLAAQLLLERIGGRADAAHRVVAPELIIRNSTAEPSAGSS